jgi:hypothetical protein
VTLTPQVRKEEVLRISRQMIGLAAAVVILLAGSACKAGAAHAQQTAGQQAATSGKKAPAKPSKTKTAEDETPLQREVRERKVITDDDLQVALAAPSGAGAPSDSDPYCNADCRDDLRQAMGVQSGHELEFRNQLTLAEHEAEIDHQWTTALHKALVAAQAYCNAQQRKQAALSKGKVQPWVQEHPSPQYEWRESQLRSDEMMARGYVDARIRDVRVSDEFRAALMQEMWNAGVAQACGETALP